MFCICSKLYAQQNFGLLNHIKRIETKLYADSSKSLLLTQIVAPDFSGNFTEIENRFLAKPNITYWFKLDLDSVDLSAIEKWYVSFRYYDKITLYFASEGEIDSIQGGLRNTNDSGINDFTDIPFYRNQLINGRFLYARINNYNNAAFIEPPLISNDFHISFINNYIHQSALKKQIPYFIFIGGIGLILSYFIGIYFLYRDPQFIIYSLYLFSLLFYLGVKATLIQDFLRLHAPYFIFYYNSVIQVVVNIFYLIFAMYFLNAKKDFPILFKLIRFTIYLLIACVLLLTTLYIFNPFSGIEEQILMVERYYMIVFSLFAYVYILKTFKDKLALFFVGGSFIFLSGAVLALFFRNIHYMMYGAAIEIFIFSLGMGYRIKQIEDEKNSIKNEMIKIELTALRAQMNPHFIFNSLNSIRAYVISNEIKKASHYITKFSRLIRLILHYSSKELITLEDEIETLHLYVQLEELRFRQNFGFEVNLGEGVNPNNLMLPPLILQPYVENAIKHGLAPKTGEKKLNIMVSVENEKIICEIKDNGVGREYTRINGNKTKNHISVAMELTKRRINLSGNNQPENHSIKIIDLKDGENAAGTMIILKLPFRINNSNEKK
jgi:sensor histidine kinase YesM